MQVRDFRGTMTIEIISLVKAQSHPERSNNAPVLHSSTSEDVLGGGSWSGGWNITPWWGVQGSKNSNGYTAGYSYGVPGVSGAWTYSGCKHVGG